MVDIAEFFKQLIIDKEDPKKSQQVKYCFQTPNNAYEYLKFY